MAALRLNDWVAKLRLRCWLDMACSDVVQLAQLLLLQQQRGLADLQTRHNEELRQLIFGVARHADAEELLGLCESAHKAAKAALADAGRQGEADAMADDPSVHDAGSHHLECKNECQWPESKLCDDAHVHGEGSTYKECENEGQKSPTCATTLAAAPSVRPPSRTRASARGRSPTCATT